MLFVVSWSIVIVLQQFADGRHVARRSRPAWPLMLEQRSHDNGRVVSVGVLPRLHSTWSRRRARRAQDGSSSHVRPAVARLTPNTGVPREAAEITPVEPDPGHAGEGRPSPLKDAPNWGIEPVPQRLRVLGGFDTFLLWTNLGISLLVLVAASYFALSLKQALLATLVGGADREHDARARRDDRRRRARAVDGAPAGAARAARLLPRDRAERAPVPRLGVFELIVIATAAAALSDRAFGFRADLVLDARSSACSRPRWRCSGRSGSCAGSCARSGSGSSLASVALPRLVDPRPRRRLDALGRAGRRRLVLARGRPRDRALRLVDPARRRLHALLDHAPRRVLGRRARLPAADAVPVRLRLDPRALAPRHRRADRGADHGRGRRRRQLPRAARADGGRDRRGLRERVLGAPCRRRTCSRTCRSGALVVGTAVVATIGALAFDLTDYQQFLLLLGAFFVPLFGVLLADWLLNGMHYEPDDVFRAPALRPGMIAAWLAGFAVYEWLAQTQGLGFWTDFLARLNPPGLRRSARRSRASRSRSRSPRPSRSRPGGPARSPSRATPDAVT